MINLKKINKSVDCNILIGLGICLLFYFGVAFAFGVQICADSRGYIEMVSAREPIYPLFLAFFRWIFGEPYLNAVIIIQNLLMVIAVWMTVSFLKKQFSLSAVWYYLLLFVNFGVALLCQFVAKRGSIYSNSILTEGIAIPLWMILILTLWKYLLCEKKSYLFGMLILAGILIDIRKQMAVGYVVIMCVLFFHYVGRKGFWKKIFIALAGAIVTFILAILFTRAYNYCLRGEFAQNTRDMNLVLTTTLYVADREDAQLIDDADVRELFIETYDILDENKSNYKYAGKGWSQLSEHYAENYDKITLDTTAYGFVDFAVNKGFAEGMEAEQEADRMSGVIVTSLLKDNIGTYAKVYLASLMEGLVNTIAKKNSILNVYAFLAYFIYIVMMALCIKNEKTRAAGVIAFSILISVFANAGIIAALIFCQTRYMIYNMALFYMMFIVMFAILINEYKNAKVKK